MYNRGSNAFTMYQIANYNAYLTDKNNKHIKKQQVKKMTEIIPPPQPHQIFDEKQKQEQEKEIEQTLDKETAKIYSLNGGNRLQYLRSKNLIKEFHEEHNYSLSVVLLDNYIVKKTMKNTKMGYYMLNNEVKSLMSLVQYKHFPKLYGYDRLSIYMSYCGEKITSQNIPDNWREQVEEIKIILEKTHVNPDDMIQRNICVLNNNINIIDFGLNTQFTSSIDNTINKLYRLLENLYKKKYLYRNHNINNN
jgi:predicted Ser/Thr protein kinase